MTAIGVILPKHIHAAAADRLPLLRTMVRARHRLPGGADRPYAGMRASAENYLWAPAGETAPQRVQLD